MKKITLLLTFLFSTFCWAQTYTTGNLPLFTAAGGELSVKLDVNPTLVSLSLTGNATRWMGIGFGQTTMTSGGDLLIFDGTTLTDRQFQGVGILPQIDSQQDWTLTSNTVTGSMRTITATRALNTGDAGDYVFNAAAVPITFVFARGQDLAIGYHGGGNCGGVSTNLTLGNNKFALANTQIYPNPSNGDFLISAPSQLTKIAVYSQSGALVKELVVSDREVEAHLADLTTGIYLLEILSDSESTWKKILIK